MTIIDGDNDSYDEISKPNRYGSGLKVWRNVDNFAHHDGDLPAIIFADGDVVYYKNGKCHRDDDLPAVIMDDGSMVYYKNGKRHRDGCLPACEWADGEVEYWIDGVWLK